MKNFVLSNGVEMPPICFGTGITHLRNIGIKGKADKIVYILKVIANRDKKNSMLNLKLPNMIKAAMNNGCICFDS